MKIFTSIYFNHINGREYIEKCIESWKLISNKIYSFNIIEEIKEVTGGVTEEVNFIEVNKEKDTNFLISGKPLIEIYKIFNRIKEINVDNEPCIFLNSDIYFNENKIKDLKKFISEIEEPNFLCGLHRFDYVENESEEKIMLPTGIDCFIFNNNFIPLIENKGFTIGKPWFDWYIPLRGIDSGFKYYHITDDIIIHKKHVYQHSEEDWLNYAKIFDPELNESNIHNRCRFYIKKFFNNNTSENVTNISNINKYKEKL